MLTVQDAAGALARLVDAHAVDDRIGPREIDVFKYAKAALAAAVGADAAQAALLGDNDFTRLHVAQETRADAVERAALGRKGIALFGRTDAQRSKAVRIARGNQLFRRHNHKRIRALDRIHRLGDSLLDTRRQKALARDDIADDLAVVRRVENRAVVLQLSAQFERVDKVSVVRERHRALAVAHNERLRVDGAHVAGCGITAVANRHIAVSEAVERLPAEHLGNQPDIPVASDHAVIVDRDPAAFLAAMLQGI